MTRFDTYHEVVDSGSVQFDWRHELVSPEGETLATTDPASGGDAIEWGASVRPLLFQSDRISQRTNTLIVPVDYDDLVPSKRGSLLHPDSGNLVCSSVGYVTGDGSWRWVPQSTMMVEEAMAESDGGARVLDVDLVDTLRPIRSNLLARFVHDRDETVEAVVGRLVHEVVPSASITATGFVVPSGSLPVGSRRYDTVDKMLEGCGHEIVADANGAVYTRPIPPSTMNDQAERWRYGVGGIPVERPKRSWRAHTPQGWEVHAGTLRTASSSVRLQVWDRDPSSEGFFQGGGEVVIGSSTLPYVEQTPQATVAGYGQLRRHGRGPALVSFETIANPEIREGDLLDLDLPDVKANGQFRVMAYRLPLEVDGLMTVTARGVYDPAFGFNFPAQPDSNCLTSISDTFDRPDENLEQTDDPIGSDPGSPDWSEHGQSWGVVENRAIQRKNGDWSLAWVVQPLCSTDQTATVDIASIPSGRFIGPAVRSDGLFGCYAALMGSDGRVTLEVWQNGNRVAVLGSAVTSSPPANQSLTLDAFGNLITVRSGSETLIQVTDGRLMGEHVGMLAFGGFPSSAPAAEEFTANVLV